MNATEPLSLISAALAPAVALSACAILVSNAQSQYSALVDRLRELNAERRRIRAEPEVPTGQVERLRSVELQLPVLYRRAGMLRTAMVLLFGAMMTILTTSFMIVAGATLRWEVLSYVTKWCFFGGLVAVFGALGALMFEVALTFRVVRYELGLSENQEYR
jgi:hypothetical protein